LHSDEDAAPAAATAPILVVEEAELEPPWPDAEAEEPESAPPCADAEPEEAEPAPPCADAESELP